MKRTATLGVLLMLCGSVLAFGAGTSATESEPAAEPMAASGEFNEAPMLAAMVAAGDLPPLPDRLPEEPAVLWPFAVDNPEIGKYGGTIQVFAVDNNPWGDLLEETERGSYIFRTNEDGEILPDLIRDYEVSADETVFTLHLRKGMKWSDGAPFVADDFVFMWKDMALNEEVKSWFNNDEPLERIVKVDDYTLRYEFKVPYPTFVLNAVSWRGGDWMRFAPKHYLEKWHIEYNEDANELAKSEGFENWWEAFNHHWQVAPSNDIEKPMVQPWVFEEFTSTYRTFVRNPYYYAVDRAGNQLPYIDRVVSSIVDPEVYNLKIMSGEADLAFMNTSFQNYPLYKENEEQGGYRVVLIPGMTGAAVAYHLNQNHSDPVQRELYQDVRFRRALSTAINRDEINESVYFGVATPRQATIPSAASYYKPEWGEDHPYAGYDPAAANRLLDEIGLTERDGDGFRKRSDGKTVQLIVGYSSGISGAEETVHELIKEYWEEIGLKVLLKPEEYAIYFERVQAGEHDVIGTAEGFEHEFKYFIVSPETIRFGPLWHQWLRANQSVQEGKTTLADYEGGTLPGEEPPQKIKDFYDLQARKYASRYRSPEYMALSEEIFDWYAEETVLIGTVGMVPTPLVAADNLGNVNVEVFWSAAGLYESGNYLSKFLFFK